MSTYRKNSERHFCQKRHRNKAHEKKLDEQKRKRRQNPFIANVAKVRMQRKQLKPKQLQGAYRESYEDYEECYEDII